MSIWRRGHVLGGLFRLLSNVIVLMCFSRRVVVFIKDAGRRCGVGHRTARDRVWVGYLTLEGGAGLP